MLLFAVILCLQAENAMSQKITLQGENLSVKDYLNTIEKQSDYLFIYDAGVNVNRKVSLNLTNRSIKEVLNNLVPILSSHLHLKRKQPEYLLPSKRNLLPVW